MERVEGRSERQSLPRLPIDVHLRAKVTENVFDPSPKRYVGDWGTNGYTTAPTPTIRIEKSSRKSACDSVCHLALKRGVTRVGKDPFETDFAIHSLGAVVRRDGGVVAQNLLPL